MVGKEDFKKKAKEMAEKARAKAQAEKAEKAEKGKQAEKGEKGEQQPARSETKRSGSQPSDMTEELKREHGEGPQEW